MYSDRLMRNMLQGMGMGMPVDLFNPFGAAGPSAPHPHPQHQDPFGAMMPIGFMSPMSMMMMDPFQSMQQAMSMANNGTNGGFSYCSSSVTSYTTDEHGRPQVYQQSSEVKSGPDGLKETKSAIRDSRTGHQELAIGHHLHEKAHIKKKSKNVYTGEEEQVEDFVGIDEAESETFEQNWARKAKNVTPNSYNELQYGQPPYGRSSRGNNSRLALTSSAQEDLGYPPTTHRHSHHSSSGSTDKAAMKTKKKKKSKDAKV